MELSPRPLIAVALGFADYGDYLGYCYSRPVLAVGGLPFLLPYLEDPEDRRAALDRVDGLILGFGRDIEPHRYGGEPHESATAYAPHRDDIELDLATEAFRRRMPVLGICRGVQVMNVALGGDLYADRSEYPGGGAEHPGGEWEAWDVVWRGVLAGEPPVTDFPRHAISFDPDSQLGKLLEGVTEVNSYHHQAVRRLGDGVRAVAWAPDGVVEAIEVPGAGPFAIGVQWEIQESWRTDERFLTVWRAFVQAAADFAAGRADGAPPARGDGPRSRPAARAQPRAPDPPDRARGAPAAP